MLVDLQEDVRVFNESTSELLKGFRDAEERAKEKRKKQREKVANFFKYGSIEKVDTAATSNQKNKTEEMEMSTFPTTSEAQPGARLRKIANSSFLVGMCPELSGEVSECEEILLNVQGDADDVGLVMAGTEDLIAAAPSSLVNQNYSGDAKGRYVGLPGLDCTSCNTAMFSQVGEGL